MDMMWATRVTVGMHMGMHHVVHGPCFHVLNWIEASTTLHCRQVTAGGMSRESCKKVRTWTFSVRKGTFSRGAGHDTANLIPSHSSSTWVIDSWLKSPLYIASLKRLQDSPGTSYNMYNNIWPSPYAYGYGSLCVYLSVCVKVFVRVFVFVYMLQWSFLLRLCVWWFRLWLCFR